MDFTPWQLFLDFGFAAAALLVGQVIRARIGLMQRLFVPACIIGGLVGWILGPRGLAVIPWSDAYAQYPGILIALIFASLPFIAERAGIRSLSRRLTNMWAYASTAILLQWGLGILFTVLVLQAIWADLHPGFGALIACGFVGGHGTAAAVDETFKGLGWEEAGSLAMTAATVGILSSIIGGMIWAKWGSLNGHARFVGSVDELPEHVRTGLVGDAHRESVGSETIYASSLDTLAFHLGILGIAATAAFYLKQGLGILLPQYSLPVFCLAYLVGWILHGLFVSTRSLHYVDRKTMQHLGGAMTDVLVVFGMASINPAILVKYAAPLLFLFLFGILLCAVIFRWLGPTFFQEYWFEKSLFTWGWITGVTAMAMALLRMVDTKNKSSALSDFGLALVLITPVEIGLVALAPRWLTNGHAWPLAISTTVLAGVLWVVTRRLNARDA